MVAVIPSKTSSYQKLSSKSFLVEKFYCCKIISSEMGSYPKISVENFLWMQCHFLENRYIPKMFIEIFCPNFFMIAKSFPRKQVPTKNFHQHFFGQNFLLLQHHFLENRFASKIYMIIFLDEHFYGCKFVSSKTGSYQKFPSTFFWKKSLLSFKNHFLENRFLPKIFIKIFWLKIFYGCKMISSYTGSYLKFSSNIFYGCKIISSETGPY